MLGPVAVTLEDCCGAESFHGLEFWQCVLEVGHKGDHYDDAGAGLYWENDDDPHCKNCKHPKSDHLPVQVDDDDAGNAQYEYLDCKGSCACVAFDFIAPAATAPVLVLPAAPLPPKREKIPRRSLKWIYDDVDFYEHQIEGVREGNKMLSFLLADEMGLGKSLQAMTVFAIDVEAGKANTCCTVCPATLKGNWAEEYERFTKFRVMVLQGTPKQRSKQLETFAASQDGENPYHVLIVNYEQVEKHLDELNAIGFDFVIADEAHNLKNPKAKRTKAFHGIVAIRYIMLTGSPMLNHVDELWSILHRINPAAFPNYYAFLHRYAVFGGYQGKQIISVKNEAELTEKLKSVMIRRLKKDVLDLPEKQRIIVKVDMLPEQRRVYKEIRDELRLVIPTDPDPLEVENALTRFLYLKQACATTACFDGMEDISGKLDRVVDDWWELYENGHKVVFFTQFRPALAALDARLLARMAKEGVPAKDAKVFQLHGDIKMDLRQPTVREWSDSGNPTPIACMLQVAGVGLNMTASGNLSFVDKLFVPKLNEQAEDRAHRIGADLTRPVTIRDYQTRGSIESRIEIILRKKAALFDGVVNDSDFKRALIKALMEEDDDE